MRGFREVGWVAAVAGTTLACYMVNLQVASERAALEDVQNRIVLAQRDIRVLQTEIGTRGRLEQLESWNVRVLALSAPQAHQFLEGGFQLAALTAPKREIDPAAPVVLASAPAAERPTVAGERAATPAARDLMQVASLRRDLPAGQAEKAVDNPPAAAARPSNMVKEAAKPAAKPADRDAAATRTAGDDSRAAGAAATTRRPAAAGENRTRETKAQQ